MRLEDFAVEAAEFELTTRTVEIRASSLSQGVTCFDDVLAYREGNSVKIYDRICDHNGGRLIPRGGNVQCPLHGWVLDPRSGKYKNVECEKPPLRSVELTGTPEELLHIDTTSKSRRLKDYDEHQTVTVQFLNHACLLIGNSKMTFATDPWLAGPACSNGWWLAMESPEDCFEKLNECDFIYISHSHPDHLHTETLNGVRKDMTMLTAPFLSGSAVRYLKHIGFSNVMACGFDERLVDDDAQLAFSLLKSGDFRDDSGLLIELGDFSALFTVDSNFIDFYRFPSWLTLLGATFTGGASGFPLCFSDYSEAEKRRLLARNRNATRAACGLMIEKSGPVCFMPYAGFFTEDAERDSYIRVNNLKNPIGAFKSVCDRNGVRLLDLAACDSFVFAGGEVIKEERRDVPRLVEKSPEHYISETKKLYGTLDSNYVERYFEESEFLGDLDLEVSLTNDEFEVTFHRFAVQFRQGSRASVSFDHPVRDRRSPTCSVNYLHVRVRKEEFIRVISNGLP